MKTKLTSTKSKLHPYRVLLGLGLGIGSITVAAPAHAFVPTQGCSGTGRASNTANFSSVEVSREVAFLRQIGLHENLGFASHKILADAACTGTCNADGSGSYSQQPGCTYTQTCGGKKSTS